MPVVDLNAILSPIIGTVADLVFPDLVTIEAPARTQDTAGDPVTTWTAIESDVPALISPVSAREQSISPVPLTITDVSILMPGVVSVPPEGRVTSATDSWDVLGVQVDVVRVMTTVLGRRQVPGTPDEDGS